MKCVHIIKWVKVRALLAENKVRFARAEQLWFIVSSKHDLSGMHHEGLHAVLQKYNNNNTIFIRRRYVVFMGLIT